MPVLVRTKGFAPLAARPAPTLSTSSFADSSAFLYFSYGKAFCSRKTAPTLKSLRVVSFIPQEKDTQTGVLFLWCGRRDLNPHGVTHRNLKPARLPISPRPRLCLPERVRAKRYSISCIFVFFSVPSFLSNSQAVPPEDILPTSVSSFHTIALSFSIP